MTEEQKVTEFGPPRDRRRGKRYLTVKNVSIFVGAVIVLFALISVASEMRWSKGDGFGRLYERRTVDAEDVAPRAPIEVVTESSINDQKAADPMLLDSISREGWLGVTPEMIPGASREATATTYPGTAGSTGISANRPLDIPKNGKVVITGGADGVQLKVEPKQ